MNIHQSSASRWWRLTPWSRNPLMRTRDRLDAVVAAVMITFVLIMVPFAAAFGTVTNTRLNDQSRADLQSRHAQTAVLIDDPHQVLVGGATGDSPDTEDHATAQWTAPDGNLQSTDVETRHDAHRGDTVAVWIDPDGHVVDEPRSGPENAAIAVGAALSAWATAAVGSFLLLCAVRWVNTRSRMRQWDREWNDVGRTPGWPVS
ncbi:Rv1733c family protein [Rhodococcus sp. LB1]|uniref:Rv1733c family protein n=1 Tax=Rhodococcus sp. LB1 TaxID=1807499 RepID=UPI00077AC278|nr:hypothetical protein [Rhodococcus sp. LB1]KXX55312.1 hypothetical protein AZG88_19620 [Rhodococcus sp. LB1]